MRRLTLEANTLVFPLLRSVLLRPSLYNIETAAKKKKRRATFEKKNKQIKQALPEPQLQLKGLTPGWGVTSIFVISLSILISGLQRTGWCLCVHCATVGFPYFGGLLVSVWSPCMHSYCLNENTDTG